MSVQLARRQGLAVDPADADASRAWICAHVRDEIVLRGQPHPKIFLLGRGFFDSLDLDAMGRRDPGAHVGSTFQLVRCGPGVVRAFIVMQMSGRDPAGDELHWAVVFEERDTPSGRAWWMALLGYATDPRTGLGLAADAWALPPGESSDPTDLPALLAQIVAPPPGARPARVLAATDLWRQDLGFTFGELAGAAPTDPLEAVAVAEALGVLGAVLAGDLVGPVVLRLTGRAWELWAPGVDLPADLDELIRWIANHREPAADTVVVVQLAVREQDEPAAPGIQAVAEHAGRWTQLWAPVRDPGDGGPRSTPTVYRWPALPIPAGGLWLGVASRVDLALGVAEA